MNDEYEEYQWQYYYYYYEEEPTVTVNTFDEGPSISYNFNVSNLSHYPINYDDNYQSYYQYYQYYYYYYEEESKYSEYEYEVDEFQIRRVQRLPPPYQPLYQYLTGVVFDVDERQRVHDNIARVYYQLLYNHNTTNYFNAVIDYMVNAEQQAITAIDQVANRIREGEDAGQGDSGMITSTLNPIISQYHTTTQNIIGYMRYFDESTRNFVSNLRGQLWNVSALVEVDSLYNYLVMYSNDLQRSVRDYEFTVRDNADALYFYMLSYQQQTLPKDELERFVGRLPMLIGFVEDNGYLRYTFGGDVLRTYATQQRSASAELIATLSREMMYLNYQMEEDRLAFRAYESYPMFYYLSSANSAMERSVDAQLASAIMLNPTNFAYDIIYGQRLSAYEEASYYYYYYDSQYYMSSWVETMKNSAVSMSADLSAVKQTAMTGVVHALGDFLRDTTGFVRKYKFKSVADRMSIANDLRKVVSNNNLSPVQYDDRMDRMVQYLNDNGYTDTITGRLNTAMRAGYQVDAQEFVANEVAKVLKTWMYKPNITKLFLGDISEDVYSTSYIQYSREQEGAASSVYDHTYENDDEIKYMKLPKIGKRSDQSHYPRRMYQPLLSEASADHGYRTRSKVRVLSELEGYPSLPKLVFFDAVQRIESQQTGGVSQLASVVGSVPDLASTDNNNNNRSRKAARKRLQPNYETVFLQGEYQQQQQQQYQQHQYQEQYQQEQEEEMKGEEAELLVAYRKEEEEKRQYQQYYYQEYVYYDIYKKEEELKKQSDKYYLYQQKKYEEAEKQAKSNTDRVTYLKYLATAYQYIISSINPHKIKKKLDTSIDKSAFDSLYAPLRRYATWAINSKDKLQAVVGDVHYELDAIDPASREGKKQLDDITKRVYRAQLIADQLRELQRFTDIVYPDNLYTSLQQPASLVTSDLAYLLTDVVDTKSTIETVREIFKEASDLVDYYAKSGPVAPQYRKRYQEVQASLNEAVADHATATADLLNFFKGTFGANVNFLDALGVQDRVGVDRKFEDDALSAFLERLSYITGQARAPTQNVTKWLGSARDDDVQAIRRSVEQYNREMGLDAFGLPLRRAAQRMDYELDEYEEEKEESKQYYPDVTHVLPSLYESEYIAYQIIEMIISKGIGEVLRMKMSVETSQDFSSSFVFPPGMFAQPSVGNDDNDTVSVSDSALSNTLIPAPTNRPLISAPYSDIGDAQYYYYYYYYYEYYEYEWEQYLPYQSPPILTMGRQRDIIDDGGGVAAAADDDDDDDVMYYLYEPNEDVVGTPPVYFEYAKYNIDDQRAMLGRFYYNVARDGDQEMPPEEYKQMDKVLESVAEQAEVLEAVLRDEPYVTPQEQTILSQVQFQMSNAEQYSRIQNKTTKHMNTRTEQVPPRLKYVNEAMRNTDPSLANLQQQVQLEGDRATLQATHTRNIAKQQDELNKYLEEINNLDRLHNEYLVQFKQYKLHEKVAKEYNYYYQELLNLNHAAVQQQYKSTLYHQEELQKLAAEGAKFMTPEYMYKLEKYRIKSLQYLIEKLDVPYINMQQLLEARNMEEVERIIGAEKYRVGALLKAKMKEDEDEFAAEIEQKKRKHEKKLAEKKAQVKEMEDVEQYLDDVKAKTKEKKEQEKEAKRAEKKAQEYTKYQEKDKKDKAAIEEYKNLYLARAKAQDDVKKEKQRLRQLRNKEIDDYNRDRAEEKQNSRALKTIDSIFDPLFAKYEKKYIKEKTKLLAEQVYNLRNANDVEVQQLKKEKLFNNLANYAAAMVNARYQYTDAHDDDREKYRLRVKMEYEYEHYNRFKRELDYANLKERDAKHTFRVIADNNRQYEVNRDFWYKHDKDSHYYTMEKDKFDEWKKYAPVEATRKSEMHTRYKDKMDQDKIIQQAKEDREAEIHAKEFAYLDADIQARNNKEKRSAEMHAKVRAKMNYDKKLKNKKELRDAAIHEKEFEYLPVGIQARKDREEREKEIHDRYKTKMDKDEEYKKSREEREAKEYEEKIKLIPDQHTAIKNKEYRAGELHPLHKTNLYEDRKYKDNWVVEEQKRHDAKLALEKDYYTTAYGRLDKKEALEYDKFNYQMRGEIRSNEIARLRYQIEGEIKGYLYYYRFLHETTMGATRVEVDLNMMSLKNTYAKDYELYKRLLVENDAKKKLLLEYKSYMYDKLNYQVTTEKQDAYKYLENRYKAIRNEEQRFDDVEAGRAFDEAVLATKPFKEAVFYRGQNNKTFRANDSLHSMMRQVQQPVVSMSEELMKHKTYIMDQYMKNVTDEREEERKMAQSSDFTSAAHMDIAEKLTKLGIFGTNDFLTELIQNKKGGALTVDNYNKINEEFFRMMGSILAGQASYIKKDRHVPAHLSSSYSQLQSVIHSIMINVPADHYGNFRTLEKIIAENKYNLQEHNENLRNYELETINASKLDVYTKAEDKKQKDEARKAKDRIEASINKKLDSLGLNKPNPYSNERASRVWKQRYLSQRVDDTFGFNRGDGEQQQWRQLDTAQRYEGQADRGKSYTGTYGSAASAGKSLMKIADEDKKITESDLELLKKVTVDKRTGYAMKVLDDGEVVPLTEEEKTTLAKIIIELCLYMYATHVKTLSESEARQYQKKILTRMEDDDGDEDLLPLLKVANTIANKLIQGNINPSKISRHIVGLAGGELSDDNDGDDDVVSEGEDAETAASSGNGYRQRRRRRRRRRRQRRQQEGEDEPMEDEES